MYPEHLVAPLRAELTEVGFADLVAPEEVDSRVKAKGTTLLVVNSVCGCAAGTARPGVLKSLDNDKKPDQLITVFAGVAADATKKAREFLLPYPPSSPAIALFRDGELVHMVERHHIEGRTAEMIGQNLKMAYDQYCEKVTA